MTLMILDHLEIAAHIHLKHTEAMGLSPLLSDFHDKSISNLNTLQIESLKIGKAFDLKIFSLSFNRDRGPIIKFIIRIELKGLQIPIRKINQTERF